MCMEGVFPSGISFSSCMIAVYVVYLLVREIMTQAIICFIPCKSWHTCICSHISQTITWPLKSRNINACINVLETNMFLTNVVLKYFCSSYSGERIGSGLGSDAAKWRKERMYILGLQTLETSALAIFFLLWKVHYV